MSGFAILVAVACLAQAPVHPPAGPAVVHSAPPAAKSDKQTGRFRLSREFLAHYGEPADSAARPPTEAAQYRPHFPDAELRLGLEDADPRIVRGALRLVLQAAEITGLLESLSLRLQEDLPPAIALLGLRTAGEAIERSAPPAGTDLPPDILVATCSRLGTQATDNPSPALREAAFEALLAARSCRKALPAALPSALKAGRIDPSPAIRRAAWLATAAAGVPVRPGDIPQDKAGLSDPVPRVASAAALTRCTMGPTTLPLILRVALATRNVPDEDAVDLLPCLARSPDAQTRALVSILAEQNSAVGHRARQLLSGTQD